MIESSHLLKFREKKLKPGEAIVAELGGWIGDMMGSGEKTQRYGVFALTTERACFYRKGLIGEIFETIPLSKVTSVETLTRLGYKVLRLHTSHDELAFKTFASKKRFDHVYDKIEELRHGSPKPADRHSDIIGQIGKLAQLRDTGALTEQEFQAKKADLLARL